MPTSLNYLVSQLTPWMRQDPRYTYLIQSVPSSQAAHKACQSGMADLGLFVGPVTAHDSVQALVYGQEPAAAIVAFDTSIESVNADVLKKALLGEPAILGLSHALVWDAAAEGLLGAPPAPQTLGDAQAIVKALQHTPKTLGLVPYSQVIPATRALRIDGLHPTESGYPWQLSDAVLIADPAWREMGERLAQSLTEQATPAPQVKIAAVGDMMLARDMGDMLRQQGPLYAYRHVRHLLLDADLTMGNLECAISDQGEPAPKAYTFRAPLTATQALVDGGFDLLNLANNHILDYGVEAMAQTFEELDGAGIAHVGAGMTEAQAHAPQFTVVNGLRLAFLGYAKYPTETSTGFPAEAFIAQGDQPGIAWADIERMRREVAAVGQQADLVIVALHGGREYWERPTAFQQEAAKALIDAGADLVWGHHTHSWQGIEFYGDGVIMYSLGDFVFDQMTTNDTAVANIWLDAQGVRQVALHPVHIGENGQPAAVGGAQGRAILDWLYSLGQLLDQ